MDAAPLSPELLRALAKIELVALDVDGVLTDGSIHYSSAPDGPTVEHQVFHVHDGAGLVQLRRSGVAVVWITGRGCGATEHRARELDCELHAGVGPKQAKLEDVQRRLGIGREATLCMGDDLPDLGLAEAAQLFFVPRDARPELRERADHVTLACGGRGAVREVCDAILEARGDGPVKTPG